MDALFNQLQNLLEQVEALDEQDQAQFLKKVIVGLGGDADRGITESGLQTLAELRAEYYVARWLADRVGGDV